MTFSTWNNLYGKRKNRIPPALKLGQFRIRLILAAEFYEICVLERRVRIVDIFID